MMLRWKAAIVAAGVVMTALPAVSGEPAPGTLDTSFSRDGKVRVFFGDGMPARVEDVVKYHSKIVSVGGVTGDESSHFALTRHLNDGPRDRVFDGDGKTITDFGAAASAFVGHRYGDHRFLAAGTAGGDFALARYRRNGTLDPKFDTDGKVTTPITAGDDVIRDIVVQDDGKILVAGHVDRPSGVALVRYEPDGSLDGDFGVNGVIIPTQSFAVRPDALELQDDGKLVIAGTDEDPESRPSWGVARYDPNGAPDHDYGTAGQSELRSFGDPGEFWRASIHDVAVYPGGRIALAGMYVNETECQTCFEVSLTQVYKSDGSAAWMAFSSRLVDAHGLAIQPDRKLIVVGYANVSNTSSHIGVMRYTPSGDADPTFSGDGLVATKVGYKSGGTSVVLQRGKIVVGGESEGKSFVRFALTRYHG